MYEIHPFDQGYRSDSPGRLTSYTWPAMALNGNWSRSWARRSPPADSPPASHEKLERRHILQPFTLTDRYTECSNTMERSRLGASQHNMKPIEAVCDELPVCQPQKQIPQRKITHDLSQVSPRKTAIDRGLSTAIGR